MKKLLLTFLSVLLIVPSLFAETYSTAVSSSPYGNIKGNKTGTEVTVNGTKWTITFDCSSTAQGVTWTGGVVTSADNKQYAQFGTASNYLKTLTFTTSAYADKAIKRISARYANASKDARVSVSSTVGGDNVSGTSATVYSSGNGYDNFTTADMTFDNKVGEISVSFSNSAVKGGMLLRWIEIEYYDVATGSTKITLDVDNLIAKCGDMVLNDNEDYDLDKESVITFSYQTDVADADITYSYTANGVDYDGFIYKFSGEEDVLLTVKATSDNSIAKSFKLNKYYRSTCPTPTFNIKDGADVYSGDVVTVDFGDAETYEWSVNGAKIEGNKYIVTEEVGTALEFVANASVMGKDGAIEETAKITVNVVDVPLTATVTFDFANYEYGMKRMSNSDYQPVGIACTYKGVTIECLTENTRLWSGDFRINKGHSIKLHCPKQSRIWNVELTGSGLTTIQIVYNSDGTATITQPSNGSTAQIKTMTVKFWEKTAAPEFEKNNGMYSFHAAKGYEYQNPTFRYKVTDSSETPARNFTDWESYEAPFSIESYANFDHNYLWVVAQSDEENRLDWSDIVYVGMFSNNGEEGVTYTHVTADEHIADGWWYVIVAKHSDGNYYAMTDKGSEMIEVVDGKIYGYESDFAARGILEHQHDGGKLTPKNGVANKVVARSASADGQHSVTVNNDGTVTIVRDGETLGFDGETFGTSEAHDNQALMLFTTGGDVNTGVDSVAVDDEAGAAAEYYNLQGMRVANPAPGHLYIKRQGSHTTKVIM